MRLRGRIPALAAAVTVAAAMTGCHLIPGFDTLDEPPPAATASPQPGDLLPAPTMAAPTMPAPTVTPPTVPMTPEIPPPIDAPAGMAPGDVPLVAAPIAVPDIERGSAARRP